MIDFPESTKVHKRIPKEAFYQHLPLTASLKSKFISDIDQIFVENSLTKENLNLFRKSDVQEIMLLSITLKKHDYDERILEVIARQNPHKLVFLMVYVDQYQLAVFYESLYKSSWMKESEFNLSLHGSNLKEIWNNLIRQIAITEPSVLQHQNETIDEQLEEQKEINHLTDLINKTETAVRKEVQPKKKFNLYTRLQEYEKQLEEIKNG